MKPLPQVIKVKPKPVNQSLVINRLEKVSKELFKNHFALITKLVGNSPGIYALYDGNELYYVGKSTDLKSRVKQHLRDKHFASWTHFSLYLVRKAEHIHEIESLLVRIANPKGNSVVPAGKSSGKIFAELKKMVKQKHEQEIQNLFGGGREKRRTESRATLNGQRNLHGLVPKPTPLFREYKGKPYKATLKPDGTIHLKGKKYNSPTAAAKAVVERSSVNGWRFWYIESLNGDWIKLDKYEA